MAAQLAHVDLNEGDLSKGRETLSEATPFADGRRSKQPSSDRRHRPRTEIFEPRGNVVGKFATAAHEHCSDLVVRDSPESARRNRCGRPKGRRVMARSLREFESDALDLCVGGVA